MTTQKKSSNALDPFLREAGAALLDAFGLASSVIQAEPTASSDAGQFVGVIGFAGEQVIGALCVTAPRESVLAIQPEEVRELNGGDEVLLDVVNEFTNMLLGRIKTLLAHRGLSVLLSTPTAAIAEKLRMSEPPVAGAVWHRFRTAHGDIHARLNVALQPGVVLDTVVAGAPEPILEGEMMMF